MKTRVALCLAVKG